LRFEYFIAKRLSGHQNKDSISRPIVKIAVGAVILSMVIMLLSVMAGKGMQQKIREKISAFAGHMQVVRYDNNQSFLTLRPVALSLELLEELRSTPGVKSVSPYITIGGLLKTPNDFEGIIFKGIDSTYHWEVFREYVKEGKIPKFESPEMSDSILISAELARRLNLKNGDKVKAYFMRPGNDKPFIRRFTIAAIYQTDFEDFDRNYILGDLRQARRLYGWNDSLTGGFEILVRDFGDIDRITASVNERIPPLYIAKSIKDLNPLMFDWLSMFDFNILVIIGILIFITALNMTTVLLVMIMERTRMIGILKTLGATDKQVVRIFLLKAAWIIALGMLAGNIIVWAIYVLQQKYGFIRLNPEIYYVKTAPLSAPFYWIAGLNLLVMVLILAALLLPARSIAAVEPSKVMKFE